MAAVCAARGCAGSFTASSCAACSGSGVRRRRRGPKGLRAAGEDYQPPPPDVDADMLCDAIGQAAALATLPIDHDGQAVTLGFGAQTDTRIIRHSSQLPGTGQALDGQAVANYIAKYATKTLTAPACPPSGSATTATSSTCAAPRTTGGSSLPPGSSAAPGLLLAAGPGRTCSATAATS
jgi:replication initiator protein RepSA